MSGKEPRFERNGDKVKVLYGEWDFCLPAADLRNVRADIAKGGLSASDTKESLRILDGAIAFAVEQGMIPAEGK